MIGIDIYDCVVVINTKEALEAFTKTRMSLGSDMAVVAGPWGAGGSVDFTAPQGKDKEKGAAATTAETTKDPTAPFNSDHVHDVKGTTATPAEEPPRRLGEYSSWGGSKKPNTPARPNAGQERKPSAIKQAIKQPIYSYVKSRGFYAGVQIDGTIVTERKDANAAFYGEPIGVQQILKGEAPLVPGKEVWIELVKPLFDTIKGAEGWHGQASPMGGAANAGQWANQMGPDPSSTYGAARDPVLGENPPPKPPRPAATGDGGITEGVMKMNVGGGGAFGASSFQSAAPTETPGARAKAAEAADEAQMNREREERERRELAGVADPRASIATAPPGYTETDGAGDTAHGSGAGPPAYVDDGAQRPGVGDTKGSGGRS